MAKLQNPAALIPQFRPLSIVRALWKRKLLIMLLGLAGTSGTVAVVWKLAPVYTATAVILVESQKIPETFVAATVQTALEAQLDTLKQQVLSTDRLWSLVDSFDLYKAERTRMTKDEVLRLMRGDISISLSRGWSARGPGAFQVEFEANRPEIAANVANQIGMFFINENLRQRTSEAAATSEFMDGQLAAAEMRLREQEAKLKEFKLSHNGELPEQEQALLATVAQSRAELLGIQEGLGRAQQNKLILESSLAYSTANLRERQERRRAATAATSGSRAAAPTQPAAPTPLEQAQSELRKLRSRYHESHPEVVRMVLEVQRLEREGPSPVPAPTERAASSSTEASGAAAATNGAADDSALIESSRIQELNAQIAAVTQELRTLEQRRARVLAESAEAQARIRNLPAREQQLAVITRDYDTSKNNYQSLLNKKLAADVATDMERLHRSQKFIMLDPARTPEKPSRPKRAMLTWAGSILSFSLAAVLAFLMELRRNTLLGEWELPHDVTIVGRIPKLELKEN
jgi:succinoglycan biosynthesis transport protein ExoP